MKSPRNSRGLTLIELVVALAVFAVLGVLSYKGVSQVLGGQAMIHDELERWRALSRALLRLENDLLQCASLPVSASQPSVPAMVSDSKRSELQWLAMTGTGAGSRRVAFRLEGDVLQWVRWEDRNGNGNPQVDALMEGVQRLEWTFIYQKKRFDHWPPDGNLTQITPDGIEVSLQVERIGHVTRLYALR